jgi:hypothetical protein
MVECLEVNSLHLFSTLTNVLHVGMCLNLAGITLNACSFSLTNPLLMAGSGIQDRQILLNYSIQVVNDLNEIMKQIKVLV